MASGVSIGGGEPPRDLVESVGFVCLTCLCLAAGVVLAVCSTGAPARHVLSTIDDTINPNDASCASLARLPKIGPVRARAIVSYRSRFAERNDARPVFERAEDLQGVTGIGPATVEAVRPWLSFDSRASDERGSVGRRP